ncbi:hypothetical protein [Ligilactobacillus acidipiscis]|uniref:hypothetical protein n=1 Tax=Ligilactobacillus acidipiscis TaxID=89059 RepID=UPI0023F782D2|nr:hypothetical protein [Ligilactobacillus acidipiscis]WEV56134.1 hypothetical protein OZX66_07710 [Ligilactobacillus acidipiscis]
MAYLTFEDYQKLGFKRIANANDFDKVEPEAETLFDVATNGYYLNHNLDDSAQSKLFLKALALQCEFANDTGASTPYETSQDDVKTVSVGRTSISTNSSISNSVDSNTGVYQLAYRLLQQGGFMYRGVLSDEKRGNWYRDVDRGGWI